MKRLINSLWSLPALIALVPFSPAAAQSGSGETSALGVAVDVLLLVAGLLCFSLCMKIFALLKGGELSPGWQLLSVSFLIFSIGQALSIALELDFLSLPSGAAGALQVLALFMIVLGVARIKKSLT